MSSEAYKLGFSHGEDVPAKSGTASSDQAWSDWRASHERGEVGTDGEAEEYVKGHMAGQVA